MGVGRQKMEGHVSGRWFSLAPGEGGDEPQRTRGSPPLFLWNNWIAERSHDLTLQSRGS